MNFKINNKAKTVAVILAVVLLGAALLGVMMQLRSLMNVEKAADFGGETVLKVDFDSPSATNSINGSLTTLDYGSVNAKVGSFTEGNGSFVYTIPSNSSDIGNGNDPYVNFDMGDSKIYFDEYSVYIMDFDVNIVSDSGCKLYFNIDYRNDNGDGLSNRDAQLVYHNGYFCLDTQNITEVGKCDGKSFHVTYVVNHEKSLIYIDGKLLCETARSYKDGAEYSQGFRMGMVDCLNKSSDFKVELDNLIINKFAPDYNGAIQKLFARPDVLLKKNTDTIFGGTFKWEDE